jgi:hypothetical protein
MFLVLLKFTQKSMLPGDLIYNNDKKQEKADKTYTKPGSI